MSDRHLRPRPHPDHIRVLLLIRGYQTALLFTIKKALRFSSVRLLFYHYYILIIRENPYLIRVDPCLLEIPQFLDPGVLLDPFERFRFDLADAFAGNVELAPDLF